MKTLHEPKRRNPIIKLDYPTDLSDKGWLIIKDEILVTQPKNTQGGRPAYADMREMINAIFYILATDIPWRMLPHDFPKWQTVRSYYDLWTRNGKLSRILFLLRSNKIRINIKKKSS